MKKRFFLVAFVVGITITSTANTSWSTNKETGKYPSWPVESTISGQVLEPKFPKLPSWPKPIGK